MQIITAVELIFGLFEIKTKILIIFQLNWDNFQFVTRNNLLPKTSQVSSPLPKNMVATATQILHINYIDSKLD